MASFRRRRRPPRGQCCLDRIDDRGQSQPAPAGLHCHLIAIGLRELSGQGLGLLAAAAQLGQPARQIQHSIGGVTAAVDKLNAANTTAQAQHLRAALILMHLPQMWNRAAFYVAICVPKSARPSS